MFKKKNIGVIAIVVIGIVLISIVSIVIIKSNQTVSAWVPAADLKTGTEVTEENIQSIQVPAGTPEGYIRNKEMIIGYKLKNNVATGQLLYPNDFLASWESFSEDNTIPEDYVVTSIQVPDARAVGGLIVAGDTIDVLGVSNSGRKQGFEEASEINGRQNIGTNVYYLLSNVKVINTNSSLSKAQSNDLSGVVNEDNQGNYYIVALSYDDAKKLRQAEGVLEIWLNISPKQNEDNPPLIKQMIGQSFSGLHDAQQPVQDKDGKILKGVPMANNADAALEMSDLSIEDLQKMEQEKQGAEKADETAVEEVQEGVQEEPQEVQGSE